MTYQLVQIKDLFTNPDVYLGKNIEIRGWVYTKREHGNLIFLEVRDGTGIIQTSIKKGVVEEASFKNAKQVTRESSLIINGVLKADKRAPGGYEIQVHKLLIEGLAEDWPIPVGAGVSFLFDNRHLYLRGESQRKIMLIRAFVFKALRQFFEEDGWVEVHMPIIITAAVEGGATLFELKYFDKKAYLTQSSQFYLEAMIQSLGKVYTIEPSFRAEKSRTRRHLTEYWHAEAEAPWMDLDEIIKVQERMISYVVQETLTNYEPLLKDLGANLDMLHNIKPPFERITYADAIKRLNDAGVNIQWGEDLGADEEHVLTKDLTKPIFVTHYPKKAKAFYHMPDPKNPEVVLNADLLAPGGYGEIIGGGQRIHDKDLLLQRIHEENLNPSDYSWYIDLRKYGTVPHSGFGLGVERFIQWMLGLEHIRYAIPFPRTPTRLYP